MSSRRKLDQSVKVKPDISLSRPRDVHSEVLPIGDLEGTTIASMHIHRRHAERHLGTHIHIPQLGEIPGQGEPNPVGQSVTQTPHASVTPVH